MSIELPRESQDGRQIDRALPANVATGSDRLQACQCSVPSFRDGRLSRLGRPL
jgi:hypothetical protein